MTKRKILIIAGAVIIIAVVAGLVIPKIAEWNKKEIVAVVPPTVTIDKPKVGNIELTSELMGTIEPDSIVYVKPLGSGEVIGIHAKTGDSVTAGQLLCEVDTKQLESSRITMETAKISYVNAKKNLDRYSVLYAAGDVAEADYQSLQDKVKTGKLQYENAKIAYNIQMESSKITAPISGKVESFQLSLHDMISPQSTVCVISGEGGKAVTFYVTERVVNGLNLGDRIRVEKNGSELEGTITEKSTMIEKESGLFKMKASIPEGSNLATGTSVKLNVVSQKAENVQIVPVDCVYYEGGKPYIYTYKDGTVHENAVNVGLSDETYCEVKEGIGADDAIVTTWTSELYDGSKVNVSNKATEDSAKKTTEEISEPAK